MAISKEEAVRIMRSRWTELSLTRRKELERDLRRAINRDLALRENSIRYGLVIGRDPGLTADDYTRKVELSERKRRPIPKPTRETYSEESAVAVMKARWLTADITKAEIHKRERAFRYAIWQGLALNMVTRINGMNIEREAGVSGEYYAAMVTRRTTENRILAAVNTHGQLANEIYALPPVSELPVLKGLNPDKIIVDEFTTPAIPLESTEEKETTMTYPNNNEARIGVGSADTHESYAIANLHPFLDDRSSIERAESLRTRFVFGKSSLRELKGVKPELVDLAQLAISISPTDFCVWDGLRTEEEQRLNVKRGVSKTMFSKHRKQPDGFSHAIDLVAWINNKPSWDWQYYPTIFDAAHAAAHKLGIADHIVWGGVWDRRLSDMSGIVGAMEETCAYANRHPGKDFIDGPHFEWRD